MIQHYSPLCSLTSLFSELSNPGNLPLTAVSVQRTLSSPNQARGKLTMTIKNHNPEELKVIYLESMPWLLQFYLHTIQIHCDGHRRGTGIVSSLCLFLTNSLHTNPLLHQMILFPVYHIHLPCLIHGPPHFNPFSHYHRRVLFK